MKKKRNKKKVLKKRNKKLNKRRIKYKKWRKERNIFLNKHKNKQDISLNKKYSDYEKIIAPNKCLINENTEEFLKFINIIEEKFKQKKKVFINMINVIDIDYGSIIILLSIIIKFKTNKIEFDGSLPIDKKSKILLIKSNFFKYLSESLEQISIEEKYDLSSDGILTHAGKCVDSELTAKILAEASINIWGGKRRMQGVQKILIELMHNTNNHADFKEKGKKHWWLSVTHVKKEKKVSFAFVDLGVGIFRSLSQKRDTWLGTLKEKIEVFYKSGNSNAELLKLILNGEYHQTITGKYYRGKGLPGIADSQSEEKNQIKNLIIVTNNVFCNLQKKEFKLINKSFHGTYVYWEVDEENESKIDV